MKKIIILVGLILASSSVSTVEAAIPVRKNLVETVSTSSEVNHEDAIIVTTSESKKEETPAPTPAPSGSRSYIAAILLTFFFGGIGVHRFYLGYTWQGVVQLLTLGGLGVWTLIDFIRIILQDLQPKGGSYS